MMKNNFEEISNTEARRYNKCIVNNRKICTRCYGSDNKRNNYTISFENDGTVNYALIEKFIYVGNHHLAFVTSLKVVGKGPDRSFDDYTTEQTKEILFEDHLAFEEDHGMVIFSNQIRKLCCNLSSSSCNLITLSVNSIEIE